MAAQIIPFPGQLAKGSEEFSAGANPRPSIWERLEDWVLMTLAIGITAAAWGSVIYGLARSVLAGA